MSTDSTQEQVERIRRGVHCYAGKGVSCEVGEAELAEFEERFAALEAENEDLKARLKLIGALNLLRADAREREHVEQTARNAELERLREAAAGAQGALREIFEMTREVVAGEVRRDRLFSYVDRIADTTSNALDRLAAALGEGEPAGEKSDADEA